jgi:hypothetical protein
MKLTDSEKVQAMIKIRCDENPEFELFVREYGILFEEGMPIFNALLKQYEKRFPAKII